MKHTKRLLSLLMAATMTVGLSITSLAADVAQDIRAVDTASASGKTVILHSNDVHGAITGYAKIAQLKKDFEAAGAEVILVDAGDYFQGAPEVSISEGKNAVDLMNAAGYDYVTIGNHEFDYGYPNLEEKMKTASFTVLCSDVQGIDTNVFKSYEIYNTKSGLKIGFFGLETPETQTKANPALMEGLDFVSKDDLYANAQQQINALKTAEADLIVCLSHLGIDDESEGNRSIDLYKKTTGIDIMLDGHSHTVMTAGPNVEPIQSTGTKFANIGVVVIDNAAKISDHYLVKVGEDGYNKEDAAVAKAAQDIIDAVNAEYGKVFAKTNVDLNGTANPGNRTEETNMGDLITDSMKWIVDNEVELPANVSKDNVVAITNGGGIRAPIAKGDITKKDVNTVLPFGNTVALVYVKGSELLEALEASTQATPGALGGFPQVSGIKFTLDVSKDYDKNAETYPASTYYGPKSIQRVTIDEVNGKEFDPTATYAVVTNNFCAAGGDTYYVFKNSATQTDTGFPLDEVLMRYITEELDELVNNTYAEPQGRITIVGTEIYNAKKAFNDIIAALADEAAYNDYSGVAAAQDAFDKAAAAEEYEKALADLKAAVPALTFKDNDFADADGNAWYDAAVDYVCSTGIMNGTGAGFEPATTLNRAMVATVIYRVAGTPAEGDKASFTDIGGWYEKSVTWAFNNDVVKGRSETIFDPLTAITRQEMAAMVVRYTKDSGADADSLTYGDKDQISAWALEDVANALAANLMKGTGTNFEPLRDMNRAECAQVAYNIYLNNLADAMK